MAARHDTMTMLAYERALEQKGMRLIGGVDEVGRGPLAGPVTVACVVMPLADDEIILGVNDSKKLSEKKRETLYEEIVRRAVALNVVSADQKTIDEINILEATKRCMKEAIDTLSVAPDTVLIDAVKIECKYPTLSVIKGDALSYSVACASIVAKVTRDRYMRQCDALYPAYGFASNKGYGSANHIAAIRACGPCPLHRRSFIKNFIDE